jgi:pentatricopeptide repeat protein
VWRKIVAGGKCVGVVLVWWQLLVSMERGESGFKPKPDVYSYNTLLKVGDRHSKGEGRDCWEIFARDRAVSGHLTRVSSHVATCQGLSRSGDVAGALSVYEGMQAQGVRPDGVTVNTLVTACARGGEEGRGQAVALLGEGQGAGVEGYTALIDALAKAGRLEQVGGPLVETLDWVYIYSHDYERVESSGLSLITVGIAGLCRGFR